LLHFQQRFLKLLHFRQLAFQLPYPLLVLLSARDRRGDDVQVFLGDEILFAYILKIVEEFVGRQAVERSRSALRFHLHRSARVESVDERCVYLRSLLFSVKRCGERGFFCARYASFPEAVVFVFFAWVQGLVAYHSLSKVLKLCTTDRRRSSTMCIPVMYGVPSSVGVVNDVAPSGQPVFAQACRILF